MKHKKERKEEKTQTNHTQKSSAYYHSQLNVSGCDLNRDNYKKNNKNQETQAHKRKEQTSSTKKVLMPYLQKALEYRCRIYL